MPIHSVAEGGQQQELVFNILASVAQEESRQIGERVSATWRHITSRGWAKIGRVPWGYQLRPATVEERTAGSPMKVLEVDAATAPFVAEMFHKVAAGASARSVSLWAAKLPHDARGGRTMPWGSVQDALRNPLYAGRPAEGVDDVLQRPVAKWPALVPDQVWQAVQTRNEGHKRMAHQATAKYLVVGLLRCRACGGPMRGDTTGSPTGRYRCGGDLYRHCHETASRNIEGQVLAEIGAALEAITSDPRVQAGLRRAWKTRQATDSPDTGQTVTRLEASFLSMARLNGRPTTTWWPKPEPIWRPQNPNCRRCGVSPGQQGRNCHRSSKCSRVQVAGQACSMVPMSLLSERCWLSWSSGLLPSENGRTSTASTSHGRC